MAKINAHFKQVCLALIFAALTAQTAKSALRYRITDIGVSDLNRSHAEGINSSGQVVGSMGDFHVSEAPFLWQPRSANSVVGAAVELDHIYEATGHWALGVNSQGQVVGLSGADAFVWQPTSPNATTGTFVKLDSLEGPLGAVSCATSINDAGQIVGVSSTFQNVDVATLWQPTPDGTDWTIVQLGDLLGNMPGDGTALAINNVGQVVGGAGSESGWNAYLWQPSNPNGGEGSMINLGALPGGRNWSTGQDINEHGQVVGYSSVSDYHTYTHAFLWNPTTPNGTDGTLVDLGDLPGGLSHSSASAINSLGQVVGWATIGGIDDPNRYHAFLWTAAEGMVDLNEYLDPIWGDGWILNFAGDINDAGQIVGYGRRHGTERAFLLTPVPELSTMTLLALAALLATLNARSIPRSA